MLIAANLPCFVQYHTSVFSTNVEGIETRQLHDFVVLVNICYLQLLLMLVLKKSESNEEETQELSVYRFKVSVNKLSLG